MFCVPAGAPLKERNKIKRPLDKAQEAVVKYELAGRKSAGAGGRKKLLTPSRKNDKLKKSR
jgi:hypothetical protein